ncbi:phosphatase [Hyphobacterium sp. CCMP332]|nr:phosphatase [Hyphobacterium sp. CCMP332]
MKLAAIDIGSNAIRFQISRVIEDDGEMKIKKLEYVRFPLRLGQDVFNLNEISEKNQEKFFKLMKAFKLLMDLYEVDHYMACATSAMREAKNGVEIARQIERKLDFDINIINGDEEAWLINKVILNSLNEEHTVHIDVGGGSTEINVYNGRKKVNSESFKIGSVRNLQGKDTPEIWEIMEKWVKKNIMGLDNLVAIGTGGNINKIYELGNTKRDNSITIKNFQKTLNEIEKMSMEYRMNHLMLNPDRADVIVPASKIYLSIMKWANAKKIVVPQVGLKDGMMALLIDKHYKAWRKSRINQIV